MTLIEVTPDIFIDPSEVCSIEKEMAISNPSGTHILFWGSVVTTKNGRKIYVKELTPQAVKELLYK